MSNALIKMNNDLNWHRILTRYLTGECSQEEKQMVNEWINESSENEKEFNDLKKTWILTGKIKSNLDEEESWRKISERISNSGNNISLYKIKQSEKKNQRHKSRFPVRNYNLKWLLRIAAVVLIALCAGYFTQHATIPGTDAQEITHNSNLQSLNTEKGEKENITLPDGTEVVLNASSSLNFPKKFQDSMRVVYLNGEAYFNVAHNPEKPFFVHVQNVRVQVMGTKFNVQGRERSSNVDVVVKEGKISVKELIQDQSEVVLTGGNLVRVSKERGIFPVEKVDPDRFLLWTRGGMHFNKVPLREVIRQIEDEFNVKISMAETSFIDEPFTSTFYHAELNEMLRVIAASMEMEGYIRNGSKIEFR